VVISLADWPGDHAKARAQLGLPSILLYLLAVDLALSAPEWWLLGWLVARKLETDGQPKRPLRLQQRSQRPPRLSKHPSQPLMTKGARSVRSISKGVR
jgi:hypothetical protein